MPLNLDKSVEDLREEEQTAHAKNKREMFIFYGLASLGFIVVVAGWWLYGYVQQVSYDRMNTGDYTVPATLQGDVQTYKLSNGKLIHLVSYKYTVDGRTYSATTFMAKRPVSERQTALYDPENPEMTRLVGTVAPEEFKQVSKPWWQTGITAIIYVLFLGGFKKFRSSKNSN